MSGTQPTSEFVVEQMLPEVRKGRMLILVDDEDRENEGDMVLAADRVTPEHVNFLAKHARGLICVPMLGERLEELQIPMMVADNSPPPSAATSVQPSAFAGRPLRAMV